MLCHNTLASPMSPNLPNSFLVVTLSHAVTILGNKKVVYWKHFCLLARVRACTLVQLQPEEDMEGYQQGSHED